MNAAFYQALIAGNDRIVVQLAACSGPEGRHRGEGEAAKYEEIRERVTMDEPELSCRTHHLSDEKRKDRVLAGKEEALQLYILLTHNIIPGAKFNPFPNHR